jgi:hypothetical protein
VNVQFSILRCVSGALVRGDLRGRHFRAGTFAALASDVRRIEPLARLVHDWTFTIHQLRGIDAGLPDGGGGSTADMLQFFRTSGEFRRLFGSARTIGLRDIGRLLTLSAHDRGFFVERWLRSARNHLGARRNATGAQVGDLRKLSWRMGARVSVRLKGGKVIAAEQVVPTGMAGDPNRADVVREKLHAEGDDVLGAARTGALWNIIHGIDDTPVARMAEAACGPEGERP